LKKKIYYFRLIRASHSCQSHAKDYTFSMNSPLGMSSLAYGEVVLGAFDEGQVEAAARRARERLGGKTDIAFLFVSCDLESLLPDLIELVQIHAHCPKVVGCSANGFVGTGREEEDKTGFSMMVLRLSASEVEYFTLQEFGTSPGWNASRKWNRDCTGWI